ncbi:hypothetical protein [Patulibacter defluvii]|uniref:hypothetical protein n=1 Tax=Patulibacter defluvii TaxID=3095358 RepID=UPI002A747A6D|nr:hypothetical protein [Patulibacter sp. DM4]
MTAHINGRRLGAALAVVAAVAVALILLMSNSAQSEPNGNADPATPLGKVAALKTAPTLTRAPGEGEASYAPSEVRKVAAVVSAAEIPLPPGLNTASTIPWDRQAGAIGYRQLPDSEVRRLLQTNALFDWLWYAAHNDLTAEQREIVLSIPSWPAFRDSAVRGHFEDAIDRIAVKGDRKFGEDFTAKLFPEKGHPPAPTGW